MGGQFAKSTKSAWKNSLPDYFLSLPLEICFQVLSYVDYVGLCRVACVNRVLRLISSDDLIWNNLHKANFNSTYSHYFADRKFFSFKYLYKETRLIEKRVKKSSAFSTSYKLVVVGDNCHGIKTSLLFGYFLNSCPDVYYKGYIPTVFDNNVMHLSAITAKDVCNLELGICDTSGHEDFERLRPLTYAGTSVYLLTFSVIDPITLEHCQNRWYPEIKYYSPNVPILLVGLNIDQRYSPKIINKLKSKNQKPLMPSDGILVAKKLNIPYLECSSNSGEGLNSVFRCAIRSILYLNATKENTSFKQYSCKEFPYLYMSAGSRGNFSAKPNTPFTSTTTASDIWCMKFTEEGDQYWYNTVTNESSWEEKFDDSHFQRNRIIQISSPYSVVHNQQWSNMISLDLQNLILSENTKSQQTTNPIPISGNNNSEEEYSSSAPSSRSKMDIFTNTFRPKSKRMSIGPVISSPFNIRKNTDSVHLNSKANNSNLTYPSTGSLRRSISLSPNSIRKSLQQQEEAEGQEPIVSAPFNLKYEWGLKVKTSENKIV